jgi:UPF0755 protein
VPVLTLVLTLVLGLSGCGSDRSGTVRVVIPSGSSFRAATDTLQRAGLVRVPILFRAYAKLRGADRRIHAGTYVLPREIGWGDIIAALRDGRGLVRSMTIPEGFALRQIVPLMASRLDVPPDSVEAAVRDTALLRALDIPTPTLEGYLFPDTYAFPEGTSARAAVRVMVQQFERVWRPAWTLRVDSIPLSRHDVLTLASIVEREARLPQERPVISAVYHNRLRIGMRLQADPTVQYALPQHQSRLLYRHLEVESPYNTYRNAGLPPGPIGSPGRAAIEAALYPADVPYLYFVAFPDGHHEFRRDLAGHEVARISARRAWDSLAARRVADSLARAGQETGRQRQD